MRGNSEYRGGLVALVIYGFSMIILELLTYINEEFTYGSSALQILLGILLISACCTLLAEPDM